MGIRDQIRAMNKRTLNRLTRKFASLSFGPFALVHHIGRRSGKPYETPIMVKPLKDGFIIALTYGPDVDWYRNVMAAGKCTITWHRKDYPVGQIAPAEASSSRRMFPFPLRQILGMMGTKDFVTMKAVET